MGVLRERIGKGGVSHLNERGKTFEREKGARESRRRKYYPGAEKKLYQKGEKEEAQRSL